MPGPPHSATQSRATSAFSSAIGTMVRNATYPVGRGAPSPISAARKMERKPSAPTIAAPEKSWPSAVFTATPSPRSSKLVTAASATRSIAACALQASSKTLCTSMRCTTMYGYLKRARKVGDRLDLLAQPEAIEHMENVGAELNAVANGAELRRAFKDTNGAAALCQGQRRGKPAKSAADNEDGFTTHCRRIARRAALFGNANALDFPLKRDAGALVDALPHGFAERLDVGRRRFAEIDQEITMHFGNLGAAKPQAATTSGVDQLPGLLARRIFEGRAAGAASDRLRRFPRFGDFVHFRRDHDGVTGRRAKHRLRENIIVGDSAMPI